jgi:hypothetical protein
LHLLVTEDSEEEEDDEELQGEIDGIDIAGLRALMEQKRVEEMQAEATAAKEPSAKAETINVDPIYLPLQLLVIFLLFGILSDVAYLVLVSIASGRGTDERGELREKLR